MAARYVLLFLSKHREWISSLWTLFIVCLWLYTNYWYCCCCFFYLKGSVDQVKSLLSFFLPPLCIVQVLWSLYPLHSVSQWTDCIKVQSKHSSWVFVFVSVCRCVCISLHRPAVNQELSNLFNELWRLDVNRMTPGTDYTISVQVRSQSSFRSHVYLYAIVLYVIILVCVSREEPVMWPRAAMLCGITPRCLCSPTLMRANWWTRPPSPVSGRQSFSLS